MFPSYCFPSEHGYFWTSAHRTPCIIELIITDNNRKYTFRRCTDVIFTSREVLLWVLGVLTGGHIDNIELKCRFWSVSQVIWYCDKQMHNYFYKLSHSYMFRHYRVILRKLVNCITKICIWNTCVTWHGIDYELPEDDTIVSKHVAVW